MGSTIPSLPEDGLPSGRVLPSSPHFDGMDPPLREYTTHLIPVPGEHHRAIAIRFHLRSIRHSKRVGHMGFRVSEPY